jgi:7-cyano-7-deazaguanine synthase in queuosine biosynthesis
MDSMRTMILSGGGIKSAFLTSMARKEGPDVTLLFFDYGQVSAAVEWRATQELARYYECTAIRYSCSSPLQPSDSLHFTLSLLNWALPIARQIGCTLIYHGLCRDDWMKIRVLQTEAGTENFMTCLKSLFGTIQITQSTIGEHIPATEVEFPLYRLHLWQVLLLGKPWYIPWQYTHSCVHAIPDQVQSICCTKCSERKRAFQYQHLTDPGQSIASQIAFAVDLADAIRAGEEADGDTANLFD